MNWNRVPVLLATLLLCLPSATAMPLNQFGFVKIGGIDQWIVVTGENRSNPIILVVHGGPGEAQWPQAAHYNSWEKEFTVVQWDQRGSGRTYGRYKATTPNVNLTQIASDGIEVAEYLCHTYGKQKIIVLGHSWGSIVAVNMVKRRPNCSQPMLALDRWRAGRSPCSRNSISSSPKLAPTRTPKASRCWKRSVSPIQRMLNSISFSKNLFAVMSPSDQDWLKGLRTATPISLGISSEDYRNLADGMTFSSEHVLADQIATDLPKTATEIKTAFFIVQGRDDVTTPTSVAVDYFKHVKAPIKQLVLIDGGHFAFMTHGEQFLGALVRKVRSVAIAREA